MNKITREHYPAALLPEDLRPSDDPNARVTVTIEAEEKPERVMTLEEILLARRLPAQKQRGNRRRNTPPTRRVG